MKERFGILLIVFAFIQCQLSAQTVTTDNPNKVSFEIDGLIIFKGIYGKEANIVWDNGFSNTTVDQNFYKRNNLKELKETAQVIDAPCP